jgi:endonuclease/exonuclease/phosphatase family metal-dependent hydrolase
MKRLPLVLFLLLFVARSAWAVTVLSWNTKHLGRDKFLVEEAALLMRDADIVTLQEVGTTNKGQEAMFKMASIWGTRVGDKICAGLSEIPDGARERYGYLWRGSRIHYIKTNGEVMKTCDSGAITIRLEKKHATALARPPAVASFLEKDTNKSFVLASVHLVPTAKHPEREVGPLFDSLKDLTGPVIVAGDFNLSSGHGAFQPAIKMGFKESLPPNERTSLKQKRRELSQAYDNLFVRGAKVARSGVVNLLTLFPQRDIKEIYNLISDHCPVWAKVEL